MFATRQQCHDSRQTLVTKINNDFLVGFDFDTCEEQEEIKSHSSPRVKIFSSTRK